MPATDPEDSSVRNPVQSVPVLFTTVSSLMTKVLALGSTLLKVIAKTIVGPELGILLEEELIAGRTDENQIDERLDIRRNIPGPAHETPLLSVRGRAPPGQTRRNSAGPRRILLPTSLAYRTSRHALGV